MVPLKVIKKKTGSYNMGTES
jgi:CTD small phosphatase-like protein 2